MKISQKQVSKNGEGELMSSREDFPANLFPMQERGGGAEDLRYLWPEMLRAIDEIRPTWVVGENVAGLATMVEGWVLTELGCSSALFQEDNLVHDYLLEQTYTIEKIAKELEGVGYSVQPMLIPAAAVGAPHRRDRIFILAHYDADTDWGDDLRIVGEDEGACRTQRLQKRNKVRKSGIPGDVRPKVQGTIENALGDGCSQREYEKQGCQRIIGNSGAGDTKRLCSKERADVTDTNGWGGREIPAPVHTGVADRNESIRDGGERDAAHTHGKGLQESQQPGRGENCEKEGAGMDNRTLRPRSDEDVADTFRKRLSAALQSGLYGSQERKDAQRPAVQFTNDAWTKGTWWDNFPTVSPVHRGNDGLPIRMDGISLPASMQPRNYRNSDRQRFNFGRWRTESLKAYGNAIVPQVMYRIFQMINEL